MNSPKVVRMGKQEKKVILKKGKEKPLRNKHHWIFSGAIQTLPSFSPGDILPVYSSEKELLGSAYFNSSSSIIGRMLSFGSEDPLACVKNNLKRAIALRKNYFKESETNAYRLINGEGDRIPGLIVDRYADVLVIQVSTLGIERIKKDILSFLMEHYPSCRMILEKSQLPSRKEEGLKNFEGLLHGEEIDEVEVVENSVKFLVSFSQSQKTGFFLDQRDMRNLVGQLANNKKVLNCFSYSGGFSLYAARMGADKIVSVDRSQSAIDLAQRNFDLNGYPSPEGSLLCEDVFQYLREDPLDYDLVILDPPAFAKKKEDIKKACRGYKDINRLALQKMPPSSLLLTCSCSYHVDEKLFQTVVFQAASESSREVQILTQHRQAFDHPVNIFHPEGKYLKSLLLYVS